MRPARLAWVATAAHLGRSPGTAEVHLGNLYDLLLAVSLAVPLQLLAACSASRAPVPDSGPRCPPPAFIDALDAGRMDGGVLIATLAGGACGDSAGSIGPLGGFRFSGGEGLGVDSVGAIYLSDADNNRIWKITNGQATVLAGNGIAGFSDGTGGPNGTAEFDSPRGIAVDSEGGIIVADLRNLRIRKVDPSGLVTTIAGNGDAGDADGPADLATLRMPTALTAAWNGTIYFVDEDRIRSISPSGWVSTLAGDGKYGVVDGTGAGDGGAEFALPSAIALDDAGYLYVTDLVIRRIDPANGSVTTFSGAIPLYGPFSDAYADGSAAVAEFGRTSGLVWAPDGLLYVADTGNGAIRAVDGSGAVHTLVMGNYRQPCFADGPPPTATLSLWGIALARDGNPLVIDDTVCAIREVFLPN